MVIRPPEVSENVDIKNYYEDDQEEDEDHNSLQQSLDSSIQRNDTNKILEEHDIQNNNNQFFIPDRSFNLISNLESIKCGAYAEMLIKEGYADEVCVCIVYYCLCMNVILLLKLC
jgi:hypothetical protein